MVPPRSDPDTRFSSYMQRSHGTLVLVRRSLAGLPSKKGACEHCPPIAQFLGPVTLTSRSVARAFETLAGRSAPRLLSLYSDQFYAVLVGSGLAVAGGREDPEPEGCLYRLGV